MKKRPKASNTVQRSLVIGLTLPVLFAAAQSHAAEPSANPSPPPNAAPPAPPSGERGAPPPVTNQPVKAGGEQSNQAPVPADAAPPPNTSAPPSPGVATPEPHAEAATTPSSDSAGSGLFEQSQADHAGDSGEASTTQGLNFGVTVRGDVFVGKAEGRRRAETKAAYGELALKLRAKKDAAGDAYAEARFRYGREGQAQELFLDLREAYVNLYAGPLDLRLGQQIIVWGRADALNPTNNLTPFDLRVRSPVEDDRRRGNVGARAFLSFAPVRVEGVWMPLYSPSELPVVLPRYVAMGDTRFPKPTLDNGLEALRIHLELASFEASVSYLYGHAPLPGLTLSDYTVGVDPPEIRVSRTAYDQHVIGADFSTAIGESLGLRGEAAFRRPLHYQDRPYAARPDLQYIAGVDHNFGAVNVILQYGGRVVFDWREETGPNPPLDPSILINVAPPLPTLVAQEINEAINQELAARNQMLFSQRKRVQHFASARIEWLLAHDTLSLSALGFMNFSTQEWLLFPKLGYHVSDTVSTTLGAEIYAGPEDTLFGLIDQQLSAGYAELRCDF
ncbi:MAG TPA: DUF1302 family protein [Polyangiaceae bacterium]|nr:DUF1302 family protein [Polyangiaceae bacterium]